MRGGGWGWGVCLLWILSLPFPIFFPLLLLTGFLSFHSIHSHVWLFLYVVARVRFCPTHPADPVPSFLFFFPVPLWLERFNKQDVVVVVHFWFKLECCFVCPTTVLFWSDEEETCFYNSLNNFFVSVPFVLMRVRTFEKISVLMSLHTLGQAEGCYYFQTDTSFLNWVSQIWKIEMNFTRYIDFENYQIIQIFNTIYISGNGKINWCFIRAIKMRSSCNLWCSFLLKIKVA